MDKNAYLKELSRELDRWMPDQEREDTLRWHEEYFQEAGPEREAQVIEELGQPAELARRLAEEGGWTKEKKKSSTGKVAGAVVGAVVLVVALVAALGIWSSRQVTPPDDSANSPGVSAPPESGSPAPSQGQSSSGESEGDYDVALDAFTEVKAEIGVGDVTVRSGSEFRIEVEVEGTVNGQPYRIGCEVEGGVLNIVSHPKNVDDNKGDCSAVVVVTVPKDWELDEVELRVGVGDVSVRELSAEEIELEVGVGDLSVTDAVADQVDLSTGVGDVKFTGSPAGTMELTTGVGGIRVKLACGADRCRYTLTSGVGTIKVGDVSTLLNASASPAGADCRVTGTTGVGDVTLTFND